MRLRLPLLCLALVLPLAHCSCQRHDDVATTPDAPAPAGAAAGAPPSEVEAGAAAEITTRNRNALAAADAASALHAYLGAVPGERARADSYWAGGSPGSPAGDATLRGVTGLEAMRIENDRPQALDRESPPRAFEIPVRLRLQTAQGRRSISGYYRMRARIDGSGWEITSASLQPALD